MRRRSLGEWLEWQSTLHPSAIDLGLERCRRVRDEMALGTADVPRIVVAGTNGKGSCVAFIESMLTAAGLRTGAYTSPHLSRYNERVRIGAQAVTDAVLVEAFERVDAARRDVSLTFFEFGTLAAADIEYVYLGGALGGRPADPGLHEDGRVRYERVARTAAFRDAVDEVAERAGRDRLALMCAEREPLACHRTLLVAPALEERGATVAHILADGGLETHGDTMDRLLEKHGLAPAGDLLGTRADAIATAISRETGHIGRVRTDRRS